MKLKAWMIGAAMAVVCGAAPVVIAAETAPEGQIAAFRRLRSEGVAAANAGDMATAAAKLAAADADVPNHPGLTVLRAKVEAARDQHARRRGPDGPLRGLWPDPRHHHRRDPAAYRHRGRIRPGIAPPHRQRRADRPARDCRPDRRGLPGGGGGLRRRPRPLPDLGRARPHHHGGEAREEPVALPGRLTRHRRRAGPGHRRAAACAVGFHFGAAPGRLHARRPQGTRWHPQDRPRVGPRAGPLRRPSRRGPGHGRRHRGQRRHGLCLRFRHRRGLAAAAAAPRRSTGCWRPASWPRRSPWWRRRTASG